MKPRIYLQHSDKRMLLALHKQVSAVADELARRAASRQTCCKPTRPAFGACVGVILFEFCRDLRRRKNYTVSQKWHYVVSL